MVSNPLNDIIQVLFLSIKNISNELHRTTNELIEYNNQDEIDLCRKTNEMIEYQCKIILNQAMSDIFGASYLLICSIFFNI